MKQKSPLSSSNQGLNHKALLSLVKASNLIACLADSFFRKYSTTDAEFNILMTLNRFSEKGLSQRELSEELVIKKSNLVGIIDKMEEKHFVKRNKVSEDRRLNRICLTSKGKDFIDTLHDDYFAEVNSLMNNLKDREKETLIESMENLNIYLGTKFKVI